MILNKAIKEEIEIKRAQGYADDEFCQLEILEDILYNDRIDDKDEIEWLQQLFTNPFNKTSEQLEGEKIAVIKLFRSLGEFDIPYDLE